MVKVELVDVKNRIKEMIVALVNVHLDIDLTINDIVDDTDLTNSRNIPLDSITAMRLLVEIEKEYNIEIPDESLEMKFFKNIDTIGSFVFEIINQYDV